MTRAFDNDSKLVPIRTNMASADAQVLKSVLQSCGIDVFLNADHMSGMGYGVQTDVLVHAGELQAAEEALKNIVALPHNHMSQQLDADGDYHECKQCGSTRVQPYQGEVPTLIPGIRIAAEANGGWFHCMQCDSYYRNQRSRFEAFPFAMVWSVLAGLFVLTLYWLIDWLKWL